MILENPLRLTFTHAPSLNLVVKRRKIVADL
jgi:hypothetical protein